MEKIKVSIEGTRPLLMHRFSVEKKETTRMKTEYIPEEEAEKCLYRNEKGEIYMPSVWFERAMIKEATNYKIAGKGKKSYKDTFLSGLDVLPLEIPLKYEKMEILSMPVVVQRARIIRSRPLFKKWSATFEIEVKDSLIQSTIVKDVLENAGRFCGVGDFRPKYGLFEVKSFEVISKK